MAKLKAIWEQVHDSLWFLPALLTLAGAGLAMALVSVGRAVPPGGAVRGIPFLFGGGAEGAHGVLSSIAAGIINTTGVVFSVTIVALQLASTQFTPRVLRQFMSDRSSQVVLGVFIGTFTYAILVQRTVRAGNEGAEAFVPALAVTGAVALALVSVGFLIYFIDHVARSIQADAIMDRVTRETIAVVERVTERDHGFGGGAGSLRLPGPAVEVRARRSGYVQHVEEHQLLDHARAHGLTVRVDRRPGDFVLAGDVLLSVWSPAGLDDALAGHLADQVVIGATRTPHQDIGLGIIELVDIAAKALSPSVNDPTTAINATDRLAELVVLLGEPGRREFVRREADGGCVIARRYSFRRVVSLAFDQIRTFGASNPYFMTHLLGTLGRIAERLPASRRRPLLRQIALIRAGLDRPAELPAERRRVRRAASRAFRVATASVIALVTLAATPLHLQLRESVPARDTRLDAAPDAIVLTFSEPVEPAVASVTVVTPAGDSIALAPPVSGDSAQVIVARWLGPVRAAGEYVVRWRVVGRDGHPVTGEYAFVLTDAAATPVESVPPVEPAPAEPPVSAAPDPGDPGTRAPEDPTGTMTFVAVRWLTYLSIVLALGALGFRAVVIGGLRRAPMLNSQTFTRPAAAAAAGIGMGAFVFVLLAAGVRLLAQHAALRAAIPDIGIGAILFDTTWGRAWIGQVVAAALGLAALRLARGGNQVGWAAAGLAGIAIAATQALSGHAAAARPAALAIGLDTTHLLAVAAWIGTLFYLLAVGLPLARGTFADRNAALVAGVVGVFSPRALALAAVVLGTGLALATVHIGSVAAIWGSEYGRSLLLKIGLVLVVLAAGAFNWRRLRPRLETGAAERALRVSIMVELTAAAAVLLATAVLVARPTP